MRGAALRSIELVARLGSIRAAARRLDVAPSSISRQIKGVEHDFGVLLFERGASGIRITPEGEVVIGHLRRTLFDLERTRAELHRRAGLSAETVALATTDSVSASFLPSLISDLFAEEHSLHVEVRVMRAAEVFEALANHSVDIGITFGEPPSLALEVEHRQELQIGLLTSADHPLARRDSVSLAEVLDYPVVAPSLPVGIFDRIAETCQKERPSFRPAVRTDSIGLIKDLVQSGRFVSLRTPLFSLDYRYMASSLAWVPIAGTPFPNDLLTVALRREDRLSDGVAGFVDRTKALLASIQMPGAPRVTP